MSSEKNPTRDRILKSAWALLEAGSGSAVRMSDIAKKAGISRQALYLHFPNRADLLIATTRYLDEVNDVDARLAVSRAAIGQDRLPAFIEAWGNYIPEIYGVAKALMAMKESDAEAELAWNDRMQAVRHGCAAAINALGDECRLSKETATDLLWTLLSVQNWEQLRHGCGWSQMEYIGHIKDVAEKALLK